MSTIVTGTVEVGCRHFTERMRRHPRVFEEVFGCPPFPGTINVRVDRPIAIQPEFSIPDPLEARQVLLVERCLINGYAAFRIRPSVIANPNEGGHGDDTVEISSCMEIPGIAPGVEVTIEFFRELE